MQVRISVTYEGEEESEVVTLKLVKIGRKWYLSAEDMQNAMLDWMFN